MVAVVVGGGLCLDIDGARPTEEVWGLGWQSRRHVSALLRRRPDASCADPRTPI